MLFVRVNMKKKHIELREEEQSKLAALLSKGSLSVKVYKRAQALLSLNRGETMQAVSEQVGVSYPTMIAIVKGYKERGLQMLYDKARSGRPVEIDGLQRAKITALACSPAPDGRSKWTLRLLANKMVELDYCEQICYSTIGKILKKTS
jgi:putative transposase